MIDSLCSYLRTLDWRSLRYVHANKLPNQIHGTGSGSRQLVRTDGSETTSRFDLLLCSALLLVAGKDGMGLGCICGSGCIWHDGIAQPWSHFLPLGLGLTASVCQPSRFHSPAVTGLIGH